MAGSCHNCLSFGRRIGPCSDKLVVDNTPPSISISAPANGSKVSVNVSVYVNASDNTSVVRVELYADGVLVSAASAAPFTTKWNTKKVVAGSHNLQCRAYDAAGNSGISQIVTVYK